MTRDTALSPSTQGSRAELAGTAEHASVVKTCAAEQVPTWLCLGKGPCPSWGCTLTSTPRHLLGAGQTAVPCVDMNLLFLRVN